MNRTAAALLTTAALLLSLGACSSEEPSKDGPLVLSPAADGGQATRAPAGDGTRATADGYAMTGVHLPAVSRPGEVSFRIVDRSGKPVTTYQPEQTKRLHLYVVRDDLAQLRHVHPELGGDGTWRGRVDLGNPGRWRVVAEFIPQRSERPVVLGTAVDVPASRRAGAVPDVARTAADDGLVRARLLGDGEVGANGKLRLAVTTSQGDPVQLGSYLGATAHLTGFAIGTRGFVHVHPLGEPEETKDGTVLTFHTTFDRAGDYRLFVQVRVDGLLHQLAVTAKVRAVS